MRCTRTIGSKYLKDKGGSTGGPGGHAPPNGMISHRENLN